jgi:hypothetical protein
MFRSGDETVKTIRHLVVLCILACPIAAFAGGSATGTVTGVLVDASFANVVYVTLSGAKAGNPPCSTSSRGQFVIPVTVVADYAYMFSLVLSAQQTGATVTITGQNQCNVDNNVETIQNIHIG